MPLVTLSHALGAGGPEIGQKLAERLNLHYIDQELISQAALRYGLLEQKFSNLDEAKPSLVLRVRVMAPFDLRVKHLGRRLAVQTGEHTNPRMVHDMARRDDTEKAGRMRYLYEVNVRDPALYDLVINTEKLPIDTAVEIIAGALQRPDMATTPASQQMIADRALASRVQLALATHPEARRYRITVEAKTGGVALAGTGAMDEAADVARG
jgi:cytidylate kinase